MLRKRVLYLSAALVALNAALALNWSRTSASEMSDSDPCKDPPCTCGRDAGENPICIVYLYDQCTTKFDCEGAH